MTPSWYDLLGVAPDASSDEIRAAWRTAIADLDPTDRRFRLLNEAAEVLLDPAKRAAYDHSLVEVFRDGRYAPSSTTDAQQPSRDHATSAGTGFEPVVEGTSPGLVTGASAPSSTTERRNIPSWLLAGLAVLVAAMLGVAVWLYGQPSDQQVADATTEAQGAAERAVQTVLAYDYRTLDEDQAAAEALLTDDYRSEYARLFAVIRENADRIKPVVTVDPPIASGIVRSGEDRVQVLVFFNRPTTNVENTEPIIYRDQATLTMQKVGEDWLVDDIITQPPPA